jgi:hypothetical protein
MSRSIGIVQKDNQYQNLVVNDTLAGLRKVAADAIDALTITTNTLTLDGKNITPQSVSTIDATIANLTITSSLLLPTTGGIASNLDYYEEFSSTIDFKSTIYPAGTIVSVPYKIVRVGKQVTLTLTAVTHITDVLGTNATITATGGQIPERFRPVLTGQFVLPLIIVGISVGIDNGASTNVIATLDTSGNMVLYKNTYLTGVFTASGQITQVQAITLSYTV